MFKLLTAVVFSVGLLLANTTDTKAEEFNKPPTCNDASSECLYSRRVYQLEQSTKGCRETRKLEKGMTYSICRLNGRPVSASESLTEFGDGMSYWFNNGQVVAIRWFHNGNLAYFNQGKVTELYLDGGSEIQRKFSIKERQELEKIAQNGFRDIFRKLNVR
ncbi:MAG: hypothetical protein VKL59_01880 [Nostocaceae cyanobacterium]|nr:hypothetical protein [Nostocaceae cyanobacterium]